MKRFLISAAIMSIVITHDAYAGGGGGPVGATEYTQIANNAQLLLMVARQTDSLVEEVKTAQATLQSVQNLGNIDWSLAEPALMQVFQASQQALGVSYQMQNIDQAFRDAYSTYQTVQDFSSSYQGWTDNTMDSLKAVLRAANIQSNNFASENMAMSYFSSLSNNAVGQTQAIQAGNAISGQLIGQLQKMRQLQMAQMNAQNAFMAHQVNTEAAAKAAFENKIKIHQGGNNVQYNLGN
jgi:P-type conjugative transfer protein TrbJ